MLLPNIAAKMAQEGTTPDNGAEALEQIPAVVTRRDAANKIVEETGCSVTEAFNTLQWIEGFVQRARNSDYATQYPTPKQMSGRNYEVFDDIMPHGTAPTPGSAADLVNQALLDPARGETSLWHDQESRYDRVYCTVQVALVAVQLG